MISLNEIIALTDKKGYQSIEIDIDVQLSLARDIKSQHGILLTEWIAHDPVLNISKWYVLYFCQNCWLCLISAVHPTRPFLLDLSQWFPVTSRLQRAIHDLTKIRTKKLPDKRPWLNHGFFATGVLNPHQKSNRHAKKSYVFNKVLGNGVHEIPVGPVHAGIIEPGHFRFSVVGERIIKLEERLGYNHKGIHALLIEKNIIDAAKIIARISGDNNVAYSFAFSLVCEKLTGFQQDKITQCIRAILLERERLINHIADIGAIINDTGLVTLATQFSILKENLLRENERLTGHRYMMDVITPHQHLALWQNDVIKVMCDQLSHVRLQLLELSAICKAHHGLQDRLKLTGILPHDSACSLAVVGIAAKASGIALDARASSPHYPYSEIDFTVITAKTGDVSARVQVRFDESLQSIALIEAFLALDKSAWADNSPKRVGVNNQCSTDNSHLVMGGNMVTSNKSTDLPTASPSSSEDEFAIACVEGWRGTVTVALKLRETKIQWCHFHDPSWQNWLSLSHAVIDNIVADFPLINKSFNLSYSGEDS